MKKFFLILTAATFFVACQTAEKEAEKTLTEEEKAQAGADVANYTTIEWLDSINQDLGKIKEGQVLEINYRFKNTGTKPLVIENVNATCGCTVPEKPEKPFAPGEEGVIKAKFDSKGRPGAQTKTVTVLANTNPTREYYLNFKVEVESTK